MVEENPFLSSFYEDRRKYAFQTQLFFLLSRFQQQQELFQQDLFSPVTVSDYLFAKDRIFAGLTLDPNELALYDRVYERARAAGDQAGPGHLPAGPARRAARSASRSAAATSSASSTRPTSRSSAKAYNDFFFHYEDTPLLVVNTCDIDFVRRREDLEELVGGDPAAPEGDPALHARLAAEARLTHGVGDRPTPSDLAVRHPSNGRDPSTGPAPEVGMSTQRR